jgi:hypothetical protein
MNTVANVFFGVMFLWGCLVYGSWCFGSMGLMRDFSFWRRWMIFALPIMPPVFFSIAIGYYVWETIKETWQAKE